VLDERGVRSAGRIDLTAEALHAFARQLTQADDRRALATVALLLLFGCESITADTRLRASSVALERGVQ